LLEQAQGGRDMGAISHDTLHGHSPRVGGNHGTVSFRDDPVQPVGPAQICGNLEHCWAKYPCYVVAGLVETRAGRVQTSDEGREDFSGGLEALRAGQPPGSNNPFTTRGPGRRPPLPLAAYQTMSGSTGEARLFLRTWSTKLGSFAGPGKSKNWPEFTQLYDLYPWGPATKLGPTPGLWH